MCDTGDVKRLPLLLFSLLPSYGQQPSTGVTAEWDVRANLKGLAESVRSIQPVLGDAKPEQWLAKGAPDAYVKQLESAQNSIEYLVGATAKLADNPERLSLALETLFRLQHVQSLSGSLREGIRRYQSPAMSDRLARLLGETANYGDKLRQQVLDLATTREEELKIMNDEAQRCRGSLTQQTPPSGRGDSRRNRTVRRSGAGERQ